METQQIDMLFLELSQFTKARTDTEIKLTNKIKRTSGRINILLSKFESQYPLEREMIADIKTLQSEI